MERKYTVLSEFAASKQPHFRLEKFDASLPLIVELEETSNRMQKYLRAFEKKHPGVLESIGCRTETGSPARVGNGEASAKTNGTRPGSGDGATSKAVMDKSTSASLVKFVKEVGSIPHKGQTDVQTHICGWCILSNTPYGRYSA